MKALSFHPKLAAVLDLLVNVIMVWWLGNLGIFKSWWFVVVWFVVRSIAWFAIIRLVYYPAEISRWKHFASLVFMSLGAISLLLFIEWKVAWYIAVLLFLVLSFVSFWILPTANVVISTFLKPHLRWRFIMSVVGLAGIFLSVNAITAFQIFYNISIWVWIGLAALLSALAAGWWWYEYAVPISKRLAFWIGLWFLLMVQIIWVVQMLPLGYLTSSTFLVWIWYVFWLLARFNLHSEGINWKKQMFFLSSNAFLILFFLIFIVRWK